MLATKKAQLKKLLEELNAISKRNEGKSMSAEDGTAFDAKAKEAQDLQQEIETEEKRNGALSGLNRFANTVTDPAVPNDDQPGTEGKSANRQNATVGYLTLGAMAAASDGLKHFLANNMPKGAGVHLYTAPKNFGRQKSTGLLIPLTAAMMVAVKAVPTISDGVIEPTRLSDIVRSEERQKITLRDVLDIGTMTGDSIKYIRQTYTRGAANVAEGAAKPEATISFEPRTAVAKKTAVWIPVNDEQLSDFQELARIIDTELLWDVDKAQEEGLAYGDGTGEEFEGFFNDDLIQAARFESGDTIIDTVRRAMTDVAVAGYESNAALLDPLDWEKVVLAKGSDLRYVWTVVTEEGVLRLHGIKVVETTAVRDFQGNETDARNLLVGDFRRGATLWDREGPSVQVGYINDQFIKNQRTILAERRAAFAVRRPLAFRKYQTQEAVAS